MGERIKSVGYTLVGIVGFAAILAIPALFIVGAEWLSERLLPWLQRASVLSFALLVLLILPLSAFRRCRPFTSVVMLIASCIFGATVWMEGLLLTMTLWGIVAVVIGLVMMGVGVVPMAMLATLFRGMWGTLAELVILTFLTFGSRFFALLISD